MKASRVLAHPVPTLLAAVLMAALAQSVALAAAKRLAVLPPAGAGPKDAPIKAKIVHALKKNKVRVVEGRKLQRTLRKDGAPGSDAEWVKLARKLKVDGFVGTTVSHDGNRQNVEVVIRNGADGSLAGQETFAAKGKPKKVSAVVAGTFWKKLGPAVKQTAAPGKEEVGLPPPVVGLDKPSGDLGEASGGGLTGGMGSSSASSAPPTPTPAKHETKVASADVKATMPAKGDRDLDAGDGTVARATPEGNRFERAENGLDTYELEVDFRTLRRTFDYSPTAAAQQYSLNFNPVAGGRAAYFPIHYLGVFVQGEFGAGLKTDVSVSYPTGTREIVGGAQFRYPLSFGQVGASAAYFNHAFLIQDTTAPDDASRLTLTIPNTVYSGVRLAARGQFRVIRRLQVTVDLGYRLVTTLGGGNGEVKSSQYFPNAGNPNGFDGRAVVGWALGSMFEIRGGVDYRRYGFGSLQGTTAGGAPINASGATDQYFGISLGVAALLR